MAAVIRQGEILRPEYKDKDVKIMIQAFKIISAPVLILAALTLPVRAEPAQAIVPPIAPPPAAAPAAPVCSPIAEWDAALRQNPQDREALQKRGEAHAGKGELDCAVSDFGAALALTPPDGTNNAAILALRSAAYSTRGQIDLALADLAEAILMAPERSDLLYSHGALKAKKSDFSGAADDFTAVLALDPQNAPASLGLGMAYVGLGNSSRAIAAFNRVLEIDSRSALAYYNLGLIYAASGDTAEALSYFNSAIDIDPNLLPAYIGRGGVYAAKGEFEPAIADYSRALTLDPSAAAAYTGRGSAYRARGDMAQAIADLSRATALDPRNAGGFYNLGLVRYFTKKYGDALKAFARSAELTNDPNAKFYPAFWAYMAKAKLGFNGKTILARVMAKMDPAKWPAPVAAIYQESLPPAELPAKAADAPEKQAGLLCEAYFYQGEWYLINGQQDQAVAAFKAAAATRELNRPEYSAARIELGALGETVD
jgi:tetratricopeptide (TPR) repeat protein